MRTFRTYIRKGLLVLLGSEAVDGVGHGGFHGVEAYGEEGDQDGGGGAEGEDPPGDGRAIGEVLEPAVHREPGERRGDQQGDED